MGALSLYPFKFPGYLHQPPNLEKWLDSEVFFWSCAKHFWYRFCPRWYQVHERLANRCVKLGARVAEARRLLTVIYYMLKRNQFYEKDYHRGAWLLAGCSDNVCWHRSVDEAPGPGRIAIVWWVSIEAHLDQIIQAEHE